MLAAASFIAGLIVAAGSPEQDMAERFVNAWAKQDFKAMHDELTSDAQRDFSTNKFAEAYRRAQRTATAIAIRPGGAHGSGDSVKVDVGVRTELFGTVDGSLNLPVQDGKIAWDPHLTFPDLQDGELVGRKLKLPARAALLAADGTPLARGTGTSRTSPLGPAAIDVAGEVGTPTGDERAELEKRGYPTSARVGVSGLELAFNTTLAGQPGGELLAVANETGGGDVPDSTQGRTLATAEEKPGRDVKTTIDPKLQRAAVQALAGQSGGVAVLDAKNGSIKALAGQAFSTPVPPGSAYKIVTTVAALESGKVKLDDTFPVQDSVVAGHLIYNAHHEACGGTFEQAFAKSCNSVFAPLGIEVGNDKMVETAEKFGFNEPPKLFNKEAMELIDPPASTIPEQIGDDDDLADTGYGQGKLLATPLELASMSQTIATGGVRWPTRITHDPELRSDAHAVRVTSPKIAAIVRTLMIEVVTGGTGTAASLPGKVQVAGKTGTAQLGIPKEGENGQPQKPEIDPDTGQPFPPEQKVDAWFTAFAPAAKPKLAVAAMVVDADGDGGEVAAPIVRQVLAAGLL